MLKFEEEIKKFKPSLEIDKIEENVQTDSMEDLLDILKQMTKTKNNIDKE